MEKSRREVSPSEGKSWLNSDDIANHRVCRSHCSDGTLCLPRTTVKNPALNGMFDI